MVLGSFMLGKWEVWDRQINVEGGLQEILCSYSEAKVGKKTFKEIHNLHNIGNMKVKSKLEADYYLQSKRSALSYPILY